MARLFILASLMSASLMTQAAMPSWLADCFSKSTYQTQTSWGEYAVSKATEFKQAILDDPYRALGGIMIGACAIAVLFKAKEAYDIKRTVHNATGRVVDSYDNTTGN